MNHIPRFYTVLERIESKIKFMTKGLLCRTEYFHCVQRPYSIMVQSQTFSECPVGSAEEDPRNKIPMIQISILFGY